MSQKSVFSIHGVARCAHVPGVVPGPGARLPRHDGVHQRLYPVLQGWILWIVEIGVDIEDIVLDWVDMMHLGTAVTTVYTKLECSSSKQKWRPAQ